MNTNRILILTSLVFASIMSLTAQITERHRPAKWDSLVYGGCFMDRFKPIPVIGELNHDVWGTKTVSPRYSDNGLEDNINSYWGGNAILGDDGRYHLFVCGWPENSPKGHMFWHKSTVFHAIADEPMGPYKVRRSIGPGHNPTIYKTKEGKYILYVIKGRYESSNINGPWKRSNFEFDARDREIIEGLSNFTFAQREDGSYLGVCRGGGIWFSETGNSTYCQVTDKRVYPPVEGKFEDPLVWRTNVQYHLVVNDWLGRIAWYLRSKDGVHWKVEPGEAYLPGIAVYEDGRKEDWFKYERLRVLQDKYGRATQAHLAVIDTIKWNDLAYDNHSSKHLIVPLTVGRLMEVKNNRPITSKTKTIEMKIFAEDDFNPHNDIDLNSLRFGASERVNYGRGAKLIDSRKEGEDLVLIFEGKGNGLTADNFAGKLLGKTNSGQLLFAYCRLPGVVYNEAILSAKGPVIKASKGQSIAQVEVQNFGQVRSNVSSIKIKMQVNGKSRTIATSKVRPLEAFEKTTVSLKLKQAFKKSEAYTIEVIINDNKNSDSFSTQLKWEE